MELTGYDIEVFREIDTDLPDIDIDEFTGQFDDWMIDELKKIGLDTARAVLEKNNEFLLNRTELEEEHIQDIKEILKQALENMDNNE